MMPDLGKYAGPVLSAYAVSLVLILAVFFAIVGFMPNRWPVPSVALLWSLLTGSGA